MIGETLSGNYRLTEVIGRGGYADVYLARDLRSNAVVAVKILHSHFARDPDIAARFEREVSLARRLQTPFVARILDAGHEPGSPPYMVMEYVQGLTLAEHVRRHQPFPIDEAEGILDQLLGALKLAHALGIIHRDIKPQNLMLDAAGRLKVLDFGIARVAGAGTITADGQLLGTPEYMAPEQLEGRPIDARADLYAAGAVLYHMLAGRPPYIRQSESDIWELVRRIRSELPPPIQHLRRDAPPALVAVVERAMSRVVEQRYQTAFEMQQALAEASGADPPTPQPFALSQPILPPDRAQPGRESDPLQQTHIMPSLGGASSEPEAGPPPAPEFEQTRVADVSPPSTEAFQSPPPPQQGPPQQAYVPYSPPPYQPPPDGPGGPPGAQAPIRFQPWQIAGLAVGAVALVLAGVMIGRLASGAGGSATPTATPTRVAVATATNPPATTVPATAAAKVPTPAPAIAPVASPSPSVVANTQPKPSPLAPAKPTSAPASPAVPKPTAPASKPGILLTDNFDRAESGQLPRTSSRPDDYVFAYDRGEYVMTKVNPALPAAPIVFVPGTYDNSVIAVDVRITGLVQARYAFVVCRDQSSGGQTKQYRISIVPEGRRAILSRWDAGSQSVLAETRDNPAIKPGDATNRLELRCDGPRIEAKVNGTIVASAEDGALTSGEHGLGAGTFSGVEGTLEARFDNLEVRTP